MPAYDEEFCISVNIQKTVEVLNTLGLNYEIIIVDDGSSDKTYKEAQKIENILSKVKVKRTDSHKGKGGALKYGFQFAKGDLVVFLDADLDLPPDHIGPFLEKMESSKSDIVVGSKRSSQFHSHYPKIRQTLSFLYQATIRILFALKVTDTQTGLKLFRYEVLKKVLPRVPTKGYAFDLELLVNAHRLGYNIVEVPVSLNLRRNSGWRKIKLVEICRMLIDTLAIFYRVRLLHY